MCPSLQHDLDLGDSPHNELVARADSGPSDLLREELAPAEPTVVYNTYWKFAAERQRIFFRKLRGESQPWSHDPILRRYKFTNVYRASDRVSQYLIRHVIYNGPQDERNLLFRILLFKLFNRITTWEHLEDKLGELHLDKVGFSDIDAVLSSLIEAGTAIYSAAYIMPSPRTFGYMRKHTNHLALLQKMLSDGLPRKVSNASSMSQVFEMLRGYYSIGDFLAYQYAVDINYSTLTEFSEMEFVVPGPGAKSGIKKCFSDLGGLSEVEVIQLIAERQEREFDRLGLNFQSLWGRPLQLIDCQNLFCEVDKYSRLAHPDIGGGSGRNNIKQTYSRTPKPINYMFPPDWGINQRIESDR